VSVGVTATATATAVCTDDHFILNISAATGPEAQYIVGTYINVGDGGLPNPQYTSAQATEFTIDTLVSNGFQVYSGDTGGYGGDLAYATDGGIIVFAATEPTTAEYVSVEGLVDDCTIAADDTFNCNNAIDGSGFFYSGTYLDIGACGNTDDCNTITLTAVCPVDGTAIIT
jgi:hypothetical protein